MTKKEAIRTIIDLLIKYNISQQEIVNKLIRLWKKAYKSLK